MALPTVTQALAGNFGMNSVVEEIYIAPNGGDPMERVEQIEAVVDCGLYGDRYMRRTGYWSGVDECQVTLIEKEDIESIRKESDIQIANGQHRRNIVTQCVRLEKLRGKQFAVGEAVLEYDCPRPPCSYIQGITQKGMTKALGRTRGGICARVVKSGVIRVGDSIQVL